MPACGIGPIKDGRMPIFYLLDLLLCAPRIFMPHKHPRTIHRDNVLYRGRCASFAVCVCVRARTRDECLVTCMDSLAHVCVCVSGLTYNLFPMLMLADLFITFAICFDGYERNHFGHYRYTHRVSSRARRYLHVTAIAMLPATRCTSHFTSCPSSPPCIYD